MTQLTFHFHLIRNISQNISPLRTSSAPQHAATAPTGLYWFFWQTFLGSLPQPSSSSVTTTPPPSILSALSTSASRPASRSMPSYCTLMSSVTALISSPVTQRSDGKERLLPFHLTHAPMRWRRRTGWFQEAAGSVSTLRKASSATSHSKYKGSENKHNFAHKEHRKSLYKAASPHYVTSARRHRRSTAGLRAAQCHTSQKKSQAHTLRRDGKDQGPTTVSDLHSSPCPAWRRARRPTPLTILTSSKKKSQADGAFSVRVRWPHRVTLLLLVFF